jgi:hypothetical protein
VFTLGQCQPVGQQYLSEDHAEAAHKPWRRTSEGTIYSYFECPTEDGQPLGAILSLTERTGRLRVRIASLRSDCGTKLFLRPDQDYIDRLENSIKDQISRNARFRYTESKRC